jgi:hypothetical protein
MEILEDDGFFISEDVYRAITHDFVGKRLTSIRDCLQVVGTDICRVYVDDGIWLSYIAKQVSDGNKNFVVTDARYKNERDFLRSIGAFLVLIKRKSLDKMEKDTHISENDLGDDSEYDVVVNNDSCKNHLQSSMAMWYLLKKNGIKSNY